MVTDATIYVVEDHSAVRDAIRLLLECEGFRAVTFASGEDFLRRARLNHHCCLVLDLHMPGMSGLDVLERLRRDGTTTPTILMTGSPNPVAQRSADRPSVPLLQKPFAAEALVALITDALHAHQPGAS
jgi:two-component system response regulator FixJ